MRTNIDLDDDLLEAAFRYAPVKTKKELVTLALREYVENHARRDLRELKGAGDIDPDYDHRALRERGAGGPE
jgi:Arc/MetJ family transcription regulator